MRVTACALVLLLVGGCGPLHIHLHFGEKHEYIFKKNGQYWELVPNNSPASQPTSRPSESLEDALFHEIGDLQHGQ